MPDKPHVCLIVDNPLRDLEGLVLLGRQLAAKGATVTLVPMYEQGFDVPALRPDLVLVNYTRPNNADLIKSYKRAGILVGVLDTEGIGGKNPDQFAEMVKSVGCTDLVDLYCVWGQAQHAAFLRHGTVPAALLHATGCPRYDFCAAPWRAALPKPSIEPGYVLINTNFPVANPRFSDSSSDEEEAMVQAGFSREFARQFIIDAGKAYRSVLETSTRLAKHFTGCPVRPAPASVREHRLLRCARRIAEFSCTPGRHVAGVDQRCAPVDSSELLHRDRGDHAEGGALEHGVVQHAILATGRRDTGQPRRRIRVRSDRTGAAGARRTAAPGCPGNRAISAANHQRPLYRRRWRELVACRRRRFSMRSRRREVESAAASALARPSLRGVAAEAVRRALGYKASSALRRSYSAPENERRRLGKAFAPEMVNSVLRRICAAAGDGRNFVAQRVTGNSRRMSRSLSGASLQLAEAT